MILKSTLSKCVAFSFLPLVLRGRTERTTDELEFGGWVAFLSLGRGRRANHTWVESIA
jgi:hypothetical protein